MYYAYEIIVSYLLLHMSNGWLYLNFLFPYYTLVCSPPYTTIAHLKVNLLSKLTLIYYSKNKN